MTLTSEQRVDAIAHLDAIADEPFTISMSVRTDGDVIRDVAQHLVRKALARTIAKMMEDGEI